MISVDLERPGDAWEIEALLDTAFGVGRLSLSSYQLRQDVHHVAELSLVARDELGLVIGTIRFWPIEIGDARFPALLLGPIAVHPTHQGEGIGSMLIRTGIANAARIGWKLVMLVGDLEYYSRFGFARSTSTEFPMPTNPARVLFLELAPGAASGLEGKVTRPGNP
ncbi:MAG: N-acetyltransferase [Rhodobacteraceae bacterium]|nr:N-acetyltransferase [Paracoccaceae bacterium]